MFCNTCDDTRGRYDQVAKLYLYLHLQWATTEPTVHLYLREFVGDDSRGLKTPKNPRLLTVGDGGAHCTLYACASSSAATTTRVY